MLSAGKRLRAQTPPRGTRSGESRFVHDEAPELVELVRVLHRLREHVGDVVRRAHERHFELEGFDHVADEEVAPLDVRFMRS